jgi:tRNA(Arg) A34 adenosine deaminase TadA
MIGIEKQRALIRLTMIEAEAAIERGDDPYGAVICDNEGTVIVSEGNRENTTCDASAHAEIMAIRKAGQILKTKDLSKYILFCNYRPCVMCAQAIIFSRIGRVFIGSSVPSFDKLFLKAGKSVQVDWPIVVGAILDIECTEQVHRGRETRQNDLAGIVSR